MPVHSSFQILTEASSAISLHTLCKTNIAPNYVNYICFIMCEFHLTAQTVNQTDDQSILTMMNGRNCQRKVAGCIPHDVGDPGDCVGPAFTELL